MNIYENNIGDIIVLPNGKRVLVDAIGERNEVFYFEETGSRFSTGREQNWLPGTPERDPAAIADFKKNYELSCALRAAEHKAMNIIYFGGVNNQYDAEEIADAKDVLETVKQQKQLLKTRIHQENAHRDIRSATPPTLDSVIKNADMRQKQQVKGDNISRPFSPKER